MLITNVKFQMSKQAQNLKFKILTFGVWTWFDISHLDFDITILSYLAILINSAPVMLGDFLL